MKHIKKLFMLALVLCMALTVLPMSAAAETVTESTGWVEGYVSADGYMTDSIEIDRDCIMRVYFETTFEYPWVYVVGSSGRIEADSFNLTYDNGDSGEYPYGCIARFNLEPGRYSVAFTTSSIYSGGGYARMAISLTYEAHTHDYAYTEDIGPTCSRRGYIEYSCSCGDSYKEYYGEKLPHTEATSAEVPATCLATGTTAGVYCTVCKTTISGRETIPKTDHVYVSNVCTYCGRMIGICGDDLEWALETNGKLTITGSGDMYDYEVNNGPWYALRDKIKTLTLSEGITTVGDYAFQSLNFSEISIPYSLTAIGESAFRDCKKLSWINTMNVKTFGSSAFAGCSAAEGAVLLSLELTEIPSYLFADCTNLKAVNTYSDIVTIGENAFKNCSSLQTLTIPDSVTTLPKELFSGCTALTKVTLPKDLSAIPAGFFSGCTALAKISIPAGVTSLGEYAFSGCTALTDLFLPDAVASIGRQAFSGCTGITKMTIVGDAPAIGAGAFENMIATIHYNDAASGWVDVVTQGYGGSVSWSVEHTFTSVKTQHTCTERGYTTHTCICGYQYVDSYVEPSHLGTGELCHVCKKGGTCGENLIWNYDEATKTLTVSGTGAIKNYKGTSDNHAPWRGLFSPYTVILEEGITRIGTHAFDEWAVNGCAIPSTVKTIGDYAFEGSCVHEITIPENVWEIGAYAFANAYLDEITIPKNVTQIGNYAFSGAHLYEVTVQTSAYGGDYLFKDCRDLKKATIDCPNTYKYMFWCCPNLTEVILTDKVKTITNATFTQCDSLTEIVIPDSVTKIEQAFDLCKNLRSVTLPDSLTYIGYETFRYTGLTSITIPAAVTTVGYDVFENCSSLKTIYFQGEQCLPQKAVFPGVTAKAYYPAKYASKWETAIAQYSKKWGGNITWIKYDPCDTHTYGQWEQTEAATCTTVGLEASHCTNCEVTKTRTVATLEHSWDEGTASTEPTEEATGSMRYTCTVCSKTKYETIPKLEHVHKYNSAVTAPTCTEKGYTTYTCSKCGDSYVADEMAALDHDMSDWVITNATCTVDGSKYRTCSRCGEEETKAIPALDHNLTDKITAATCTADGIKVTTCSRCDYSETEVLPATGHSHVPNITAPTCKEGGYTTYTCHCGDSYVADETAALGHSIAYSVETAPTLETEGVLVGTCTRCSKTTRIVLPKLGKTAYSIEVITEPNKEAEGFGRYTWNVTDYGTFTFEAAIPDVILGDVNDDGEINVLDLMYLANYFAKGEIINQANADVNGDGLLDVRDLMFLANVFAGKESLT